jgi:hypothetical protein
MGLSVLAQTQNMMHHAFQTLLPLLKCLSMQTTVRTSALSKLKLTNRLTQELRASQDRQAKDSLKGPSCGVTSKQTTLK